MAETQPIDQMVVYSDGSMKGRLRPPTPAPSGAHNAPAAPGTGKRVGFGYVIFRAVSDWQMASAG